MTLPTDRDARNALPVWDGCMAYFPDCWAEIAKVSVLGNKQHGLGAKLRFARDVSTDHSNKVVRHMLDHAAGIVFDADGTYHLAKAAWRALAALQVAIEECNASVKDAAPTTGQLTTAQGTIGTRMVDALCGLPLGSTRLMTPENSNAQTVPPGRNVRQETAPTPGLILKLQSEDPDLVGESEDRTLYHTPQEHC